MRDHGSLTDPWQKMHRSSVDTYIVFFNLTCIPLTLRSLRSYVLILGLILLKSDVRVLAVTLTQTILSVELVELGSTSLSTVIDDACRQ
jgi:hypothetical protein